MKTLNVPYAENFGALAGFAVLKLEEVPWAAEFPYKPEVTISAAHNAGSILLRFDVVEEDVRAVCLEGNGPVWEDSCVEFFVKSPDSPFYFNFETNCIGTGLAAKRTDRSNCTHFSPELMDRIVRRSSLPVEKAGGGEGKWNLELEIPFDVLDCGPRPESLMANFYKCGDRTARPHFVSWAPIDTPSPDFHRPEFFGKLNLEW